MARLAHGGARFLASSSAEGERPHQPGVHRKKAPPHSLAEALALRLGAGGLGPELVCIEDVDFSAALAHHIIHMIGPSGAVAFLAIPQTDEARLLPAER